MNRRGAARGTFVAGARRPTAATARGALLAGGIWALVVFVAAPAWSRLPWFDPLPTWSPADTLANRAFALDVVHLADGRTGWNADRIVAEIRIPSGERGFFYARLPWLRFDTGDLSALERWPELRGVGAVGDWPGETVLTGFGQLELGAAGPLRLPAVGPLTGALGVGLPLGHGRFYPLSSSGLPVRLEAARRLALAGDWNLLAAAGLVRHGGPGDDVLDETAFPDGSLLRLGVEHARGARAARLTWSSQPRGGRREQWLTAELAVPWTATGRAGLRLAREVTGSEDRAAAWLAGLTWRLLPRPAAPTRPTAATRAP
ncbi:hypothetical protein FJ250_07260 [bacterium]|nr:hypothetical protein [bacterium]